MNVPKQLHNLGQSLWLDNITRTLLTSGTLTRYINDFSVTGLTSNPTIFDHAITSADHYDEAIRKKADEGKSSEALFFELALEDLIKAADLFRPIHDATAGVDGWVSLEVITFACGRHRRHHQGSGATARARTTPQSFHQNSGHRRRYPL